MELDRKAFHFDLDNESVERFYTGKKNPWSDIQYFLESHCFEKPQYSGYESAENIVMSYQRAYGTIDEMMNEFPWFQKCLKAATFTEIGESYDVKEFLESGMQLSPSSRPDTRKELHFDLGTAALSENYSSIRPNAWRGAWTFIRIFMERNGFIHTQYSGYESIAVMPIDKAMAIMEKLQQRYPWFKGSHGIIVPVPTHSLGLEELDFFGSEIGDMKSATAELSKRNGLEPPKDLNNEH